jgi:hypothetical protein
MAAIRSALYEILAIEHPGTVRQTFYQGTVLGVVAKTEREYKGTVVRLLSEMRRDGTIPYYWIADATRWMRKPRTYSSVEEALRRTASTYRRALWDSTDVAVEIWLEKDALAGVLVDVTDEYDVPLMVTRGYPSMSFLYSAADAILNRFEEKGQMTHIYGFGDHDPSGVDIDRAVRRGIGEAIMSMTPEGWTDLSTPEYAFDCFATFERIAVTEWQIEEWNLPTRPTKKSDTRAKNFKGESVELDAIVPSRVRELARACIEQHVDQRQLGVLQKTEAEERRLLLEMAKTFNGGAP